jgi:hypothetical protein
MATVDRAHWAKRLLDAIDAPVSDHNKYALVAWQTAEGTDARFNPLATTRKMPGSTNFNRVGVQDYTDLLSGVKATQLTLSESGHNYEPIVASLRANRAAADTLEAVRNSAWGTGALALQVLPWVKKEYDFYGGKPIGQ